VPKEVVAHQEALFHPCTARWNPPIGDSSTEKRPLLAFPWWLKENVDLKEFLSHRIVES